MDEEVVQAVLPDGQTIGIRLHNVPSDELSSVSARDQVPILDDAMKQISSIATALRAGLDQAVPDRATVEIGIAFTMSSGKLTALLVDAKGDVTIKVLLEWKRNTADGEGKDGNART